MGGAQSIDQDDLRQEELDELKQSSGFSRSVIVRLYARFKKLDINGTGLLEGEELLRIPELAMNPVHGRVLATFGCEEGLNFTEFVERMGAFNSLASKERKMKAAFDVFDIDRDGIINRQEFIDLMKSIVGENLTFEEIQELANITLAEKGALNYEEFVYLLKDSPKEFLCIEEDSDFISEDD